MAFSTASINNGCGLKSGKPCDKLMALCSFANADMVVKIVVPIAGSFELMLEGKFMLVVQYSATIFATTAPKTISQIKV